MKRILLIILVVAVLAIGGTLGYALMNLNSLISSLKPEMERVAGEALGGKVSIGAIDASILPSTSLSIKELRVSGKESTGNDSADSFTLKDISLSVQLLSLLGGKLEISSLSIARPELRLVRDSSGVRLAGLPRATTPTEGASRGNESSATAPTEAKSPSEQSSSLSLALQEFRLEDAVLTIDDHVSGKNYSLDRLNVRANVAMTGNELLLPAVSLTARALGNVPLEMRGSAIALKGNNLSIHELSIAIAKNAFSVTGDLNLATSSGTLSLVGDALRLESLAPLMALANGDVANYALQGGVSVSAKTELEGPGRFSVGGSLSLNDASTKIPQGTISGITGKVTTNGNQARTDFSTSNLAFAVNGQPITVSTAGTFAPPALTVPELKVSLFSGTLSANTSLSLNKEKPLTTSFNAENLDVSQALLAAGKKPEEHRLSGTIDTVKGSLAAPLAGPLPQALSGNVAASLSKIEIKGFNLVGAVFKTLTGLPFMKGSLYDSVPPEKRGELDGPDTVLSSVTGSFTIANGIITTKDLKASAALFDLAADGSIGFNSEIDLTATFLLNPEASAAQAKRVKELEAFFDEKKRLAIPIAIKGTAPKLVVAPNIGRLLESGGAKLISEKASDLIGKALGGNKDKAGGKKGLGGLFGF